jgi:hypothetical protein
MLSASWFFIGHTENELAKRIASVGQGLSGTALSFKNLKKIFSLVMYGKIIQR